MKRMMLHVLSVALLFLLAPVSTTVTANPITIRIITATGPNQQVGAGTVTLNFKTDPGTGTDALSHLTVNVTAGETAAQIAQSIYNQIDYTLAGVGYDATVAHQTVTNGSLTFTSDNVMIKPNIARPGQDFTTGSVTPPPGDSAPSNVSIQPQVVHAGPGKTSLQLVPVTPPSPSLHIDWQLGVMNQDDELIATSSLLDVPDTTSATSLISMFASDLSSHGTNVVATGSTLSLSTNDNDFFVLSQSSGGSLYSVLSDAIVPEPASLMLLGIGAVGAGHSAPTEMQRRPCLTRAKA